jgi:hypothetical protein
MNRRRAAEKLIAGELGFEPSLSDSEIAVQKY